MPHTITTAKVCKTRQARQAGRQATNSAGSAATGAKSEAEDGAKGRGCGLTGEWVGQLASVSCVSILGERKRAG